MLSPIICHRIFCPVRKRNVGLKIGWRTWNFAYFAEIRRTTCRLTRARKGTLVVTSSGGNAKLARVVHIEHATWTKLYKFGCKKVCIRED